MYGPYQPTPHQQVIEGIVCFSDDLRHPAHDTFLFPGSREEIGRVDPVNVGATAAKHVKLSAEASRAVGRKTFTTSTSVPEHQRVSSAQRTSHVWQIISSWLTLVLPTKQDDIRRPSRYTQVCRDWTEILLPIAVCPGGMLVA